MSRFAVPCLVLCLCQIASTAFADERSDKRLRYFAARLDAPIEEIDKGDQPLALLLEVLAVLAAEGPGADKDPDKKVPIVINRDAFNNAFGGTFDFERCLIKFNVKTKKTSLATVLEQICLQLDAGYVVRKDYIEIVPIDALRKELKHPHGCDRELRTLVTRFYENVSLEATLTDLAEKYGRTVVVSPQVQYTQKLTARLVNVPFETAIETLADMAELKLVRKSNVLLVTTKEQAAALNAEHEKRLQAERDAAERAKAREEKLNPPPREDKKP